MVVLFNNDISSKTVFVFKDWLKKMSNIPIYTFLMGDNSFSTTDLKELSPPK
jgi:hypothetical protein